MLGGAIHDWEGLRQWSGQKGAEHGVTSQKWGEKSRLSGFRSKASLDIEPSAEEGKPGGCVNGETIELARDRIWCWEC